MSGWWVAVPPSDPPSESILMGWPNGHWILPEILCPGSHHGKVNLAYFMLVVMLMGMAHWDLPPLKVGSSSGHGTRWPLM